MIVDLYRHRGYIWRNALADVRHRYVGSAMGVVWNVLQPLALILVFTVIFTRIMQRTPGPGEGSGGYVVYLCSALLPWSAFADCVGRCTQAFVHNAMYLRKLPIPEQVFVAQAALSAACSLLISYAILVGVAVVLGHEPTWHWLLLPVPLGGLIAVGFGVGMALGTLNAFIRDVGQVVPIALHVGFWLYPIVYRIDMVPEWLRRAIPFNPVYPYLESIRALFIERALPGPMLWLGMLGWAGAAALLGHVVLRRLRAELRDVI